MSNLCRALVRPSRRCLCSAASSSSPCLSACRRDENNFSKLQRSELVFAFAVVDEASDVSTTRGTTCERTTKVDSSRSSGTWYETLRFGSRRPSRPPPPAPRAIKFAVKTSGFQVVLASTSSSSCSSSSASSPCENGGGGDGVVVDKIASSSRSRATLSHGSNVVLLQFDRSSPCRTAVVSRPRFIVIILFVRGASSSRVCESSSESDVVDPSRSWIMDVRPRSLSRVRVFWGRFRVRESSR